MSTDPRSYGGKFLPQELDADPEARLAMSEAGLLFRSEAMRTLYRVAIQVAGSDAPILLTGESGTGKEIFARLLHTLSDRSGRPFVPVNCGVLTGELFADKFFGHEPGAFTGATRLQKGSFELAADGTLFLDEVGEIPLSNQVDFLRVLEERSFKRLGGEKDQGFRARIVAATNRSLTDMVRRGAFRPDLFYRLNVIPIALPSLRERSEDVAPLSEYFLWLFGQHYHRPGLALAPETLRLLLRHPWPGNVRELKKLVDLLSSGAGGRVDADTVKKHLKGPTEVHAAAAPDTDGLYGYALADLKISTRFFYSHAGKTGIAHKGEE